jgi:hypothetical protein
MARKLDYDVMQLPARDAEALRVVLNKRDDKGWELVTMALTPNTSALIAVFKREYKQTAGEPAIAHG